MEEKKERYLIIFNFGSFVYMFLIIGMSTGLVAAILDALLDLAQNFTLGRLGSALYSLVTMPIFFGLFMAFFAAFGFLPYRWLCRRGWGWPVKGIFNKVPEPSENEL